MNYLETLSDIKEAINKNQELKIAHKLVVLELISKEERSEEKSDDIFIYFYEDVIKNKLSFDFEKALTSPVYLLAQNDALTCTRLFETIDELEENSSLYSWLQSAIKFTDHLALHYLQVIKKEAPISQGEAGKERSRYIQINKKANDAEKAGRILDNLYECRNKMEHRTVSDPNTPNFQMIIPPNYKTVKKQIQKRYPEALINFRDAFQNYHK